MHQPVTIRSDRRTGVADLIGVGFGPANLALAIALEEQPRAASSSCARLTRFYEKQPRFGWHQGMLIDGATMQVSFLKDLATLRNPTSPYSFVSYLHDKGRLPDFINAKSFFPLRAEFHDYLAWAAQKFGGQVDYGCEVLGLRPVAGPDGSAEFIDVVIRQQEALFTQRCRNVVLATGLEPALPGRIESGPRIWHSSELLFKIAAIAPESPRCFVVVGAGQSAAEVVSHLYERFPGADVHAVFSRYGFSVADDSPFTNQIFDPAAVDDYFAASTETKQSMMNYHANTNYSAVDMTLIQSLYQHVYREGVTGRRRLHIHRASKLRSYEAEPDGVRAEIEFSPTSEVLTLRADAVIFATGYRPGDPLALLGELGGLCSRDTRGLLRVGRNYRVLTGKDTKVGIYLQGPTEHTHGISSGLLSNLAVRAGEIADDIVAQLSGARETEQQAAERTQ